ncbi:hypothetical protein [Corynebacterium variabile]|uniref:hypothetical protein n=1 Tax=Corynebacterium variabile TaxID=1727 RepID=UPI0028A59F67|nr:hypothetical protein [Dietzia maris]
MVGAFMFAVMTVLRVVIGLLFALLTLLGRALRGILVGISWLLGRALDGLTALMRTVRS